MRLEFAKLRAIRAYVPYLPYLPQISTYLHAYVPSFFTFLRAYVLTCLDISIYLYICISIYIYISIYITYIYIYIYISSISAFVPTCPHFSRVYVSTTNHKISWSSLLYLVLLLFSGMFDLSFHSKPHNKVLVLKLHIWKLSCGVLFFQLVHVQKQ